MRLAKKHGLTLRQSYERVGKRALIAHQRYAHAKPARDRATAGVARSVRCRLMHVLHGLRSKK